MLIIGPWREYVDQVKVACPTPEQKAILEAQIGNKLKDKEPEEETIEETTMLHSKNHLSLSLSNYLPSLLVDDPLDYMGRSFLHIPQDVDVNLRSEEPPEKCFIPKKCIHTW